MPVVTPEEGRVLEAAAQLAYCNPFLPERLELERKALGKDFHSDDRVWSADVRRPDSPTPNVVTLQKLLARTLETVHIKLRKRGASSATPHELQIYEEAVQLFLYQECYPGLGEQRSLALLYRRFAADAAEWFTIQGLHFESMDQLPHLFACFHQARRAFDAIFDRIIGSSLPAARLRASVWQSIFTCDMRRYRRALWNRMGDFPTLVTGPSGTGKELVARAIAASRYVPFEAAATTERSFFAVNLAALSPTLIESELFGHRRGSFTGAVADRKGWLETCPPSGCVFLDEIGELDRALQVKLLRVLESRTFSAVGDTAQRTFAGKLVAATNRNLSAEIHAGRFREDLYYRLCADQIQTPSLREQLDDSPGILDNLVLHMLRRAVGKEAESCLAEVCEWIATNLPANYAWPGNYRELEQCVRNVVIRKSYVPVSRRLANTTESRLYAGEMTADEVLCWYASLVYRETGTYEAAARRLGLDRRTVKAKVEAAR